MRQTKAGLRSLQQSCDRERKRGRCLMARAAHPREGAQARAPWPVSAQTASRSLGRAGVLTAQPKPPAAGAEDGGGRLRLRNRGGLLRWSRSLADGARAQAPSSARCSLSTCAEHLLPGAPLPLPCGRDRLTVVEFSFPEDGPEPAENHRPSQTAQRSTEASL